MVPAGDKPRRQTATHLRRSRPQPRRERGAAGDCRKEQLADQQTCQMTESAPHTRNGKTEETRILPFRGSRPAKPASRGGCRRVRRGPDAEACQRRLTRGGMPRAKEEEFPRNLPFPAGYPAGDPTIVTQGRKTRECPFRVPVSSGCRLGVTVVVSWSHTARISGLTDGGQHANWPFGAELRSSF